MAQQDMTGHGAALTITPVSGSDIIASLDVIAITPPTQTVEAVELPHLAVGSDNTPEYEQAIMPKTGARLIDGGDLVATLAFDPTSDWETELGGDCEVVLTWPPVTPGGASATWTFDGFISSRAAPAITSGDRLTQDVTVTVSSNVAVA